MHHRPTHKTSNAMLTAASLCLALSAVGCASNRRDTYQSAMRSTVGDLRCGDIDGARASLSIASANADDSTQKEKIKDLTSLINGADAYVRGDRSTAGSAWSQCEAPEFRQAIASNGRSLGVTLTPAPTK